MTYSIDYKKEVGTPDTWIANITYRHSAWGDSIDTQEILQFTKIEEVNMFIQVIKLYVKHEDDLTDQKMDADDLRLELLKEQPTLGVHNVFLKKLVDDLLISNSFASEEVYADIVKVSIKYYDMDGSPHHLLCDGHQELVGLMQI